MILELDELEAIRLADLELMDQSRAAEHMQISQPTFSRILATGRRKVAEAIVHGKVLRFSDVERSSLEGTGGPA